MLVVQIDLHKKSTLFGIALIVCAVCMLVGALGVHYFVAQKEKPVPGFLKILGADDGTVFVDLEGNPVTLATYADAPIVLFAWASWCPSCGEQLALIAKSASEGSAPPILAINRGETLDLARDYLSFVGKYEQLIYWVDTKDIFFKTVEGYAMPELVVYDAKGEEVFRHRGTLTEVDVRAAFASVAPR